MAATTQAKVYVNRLLRGTNLRLETLTAEKIELRRLQALEQADQFRRPVFPLPPAFEAMEPTPLLQSLAAYEERFEGFIDPSRNDVGYSYDNIYFTSPDTEVLYTLVRRNEPRRIVEIGCGNSTRVIRQALLDGQSNTELIGIDPRPRLEISQLADVFYRRPVETLADAQVFGALEASDILFIDSSHEIKTGNDIVFLFLNVIPSLPPGVFIHIHDIFLPYDYPREWVMEKRWGFNEQYLVQALLAFSGMFEVLWAGYFLQQTRPDFAQHFRHLGRRTAKSLWLRKVR